MKADLAVIEENKKREREEAGAEEGEDNSDEEIPANSGTIPAVAECELSSNRN